MLRILIVVAVLVAANACLFALFWLLDRREEKRQKAERDAAELRRKLTASHKPGALTERLRAGRDGYEYTPMPPKRTIAIAVKMAEPRRGKPIAYELEEPVRGMRQVTVRDNRVVPIDREVA